MNARELKIGLTVVTSIVAVYLILTWVKSMHLFATNRNTFEIRFTDVNGLKDGDPVTVYGLPSGNVTGIRLADDGAIVSVGIESSVKIREDASAEILVKELMGGKQIEIKPGKAGRELPPGSRFNGKVSLDFSTAFSKFGDFIDRFGENRLDSLFNGINRLAQVYIDLGDLIMKSDIEQMFTDLGAASGSLRRIMAQFDDRQLVMKLDSSLLQLNELGHKADGALGSLNSLSDKLQSNTLPQADKLMAELLKTLDEADGLLTDAKGLMSNLRDNRTAAGKFISDPAFAVELDKTLDNFNKTLTHLRYRKVLIAFTLSKKQPAVPAEE